MKYVFLIFLTVFFSKNVHGQLSEKYVDSIFQMIVLEEINIYDEELKLILFEKEHWDELVRIDTIVNDQWTRPRYKNNIFQKGIDGVIIKSNVEIDSMTFFSDPRFIQFSKKEFDENGSFRFLKILFLIKRNEVKKAKNNYPKVNYPKGIISRKNGYWTNDLIRINGNQIQLDSCHFLYQLKLNEDFSFSQTYSKNDDLCFTKEMENEIEVGTEGNFDLKYYKKLQGHYIDISSGFWKLKNNFLYLFSTERRDGIKFKIISVTEKELILETSNAEIFIKLKRVVM